jgi:hypothetical protein
MSFIPTIWESAVLRNFERSSVFASCLGRAYFGEIRSYGDTVKVPILADVAVKPYTRNSQISYDTLQATTLDIKIDQSVYYAFSLDDLDSMQSKPDIVASATRSAGLALTNAVDIDCAQVLADGAGTVLYEDTPFPAVGSHGDVLRVLGDMSKKLSQKDVPTSGRWAVLPPSMTTLLGVELIGKTTPDTTILSEGWVARCFGFDIFMSNNLPEGVCLAGVREAGTLLTQLQKTEALRDTKTFGDLCRGLCLWKAATLLPAGIVRAHYATELDE